MEPANDVIGDYMSPCGGFKLTFDDNGKVAYAYLKQGNTLVGDVWVYNRCLTPDEPEWKDRTKMPFANCKPYTKAEGQLESPVALDDIGVEWKYAGERAMAYVYLFGNLVASVGVGDKPGYSRFAAKSGPLAKLLVLEELANNG
jgi:hypothetical protein